MAPYFKRESSAADHSVRPVIRRYKKIDSVLLWQTADFRPTLSATIRSGFLNTREPVETDS